MGVIAKQTTNLYAISVIGLLISVISTLYIYQLDIKTYGYLQFVINNSRIILPIITLGALSVPIKFFEEFKMAGNKDELFSFGIIYLISAISIFLLLYSVFRSSMLNGLEYINFDVELYLETEPWILLTGFFFAVSLFLNYYISNYKLVVIPNIITEFSIKLFLPALIVAKLIFELEIKFVMFVFLIYTILVTASLGYYLYKIAPIKFVVPTKYIKERIKKIFSYTTYGFLNMLGSSLVFRLDIIMIGFFLGVEYSGYYGTILYLAGIIDLPNRGLAKITAPILAQEFERKNYSQIDNLYKKTSLNVLLSGGVLGLLIYFGAEPLFELIKNGDIYLTFIPVLLILIIGKLIDQITSLNTHILAYSNLYKYNFYFYLTLGILNLGLNYVLLTKYGMVGCAMATTISLTIFNILKLITIYIKLKMWPFSTSTISIIGFLCVLCVLLYFLPNLSSPFADLFILGVTVSIATLIGLKYFNLSEDIYNVLLGVILKFNKTISAFAK